ncbi:MAG: hypothetical protein L0G94_15215 [Brachybacterium sp.]|uniref:hypothetical protein n=1 Tax=Brachybacterium sp. TaxID=1891286 RepID=UPI0026478D56|nr:hypothetical protein [Brachybacterium sp.]MDN5688007.1 hypothetical protein [Brachybacterium sp.]
MTGKHGGFTGDLNVEAFWSRNHSKWIMQISHGSNGPRFSFRANQGIEISNRITDLIETIERKNGPIA